MPHIGLSRFLLFLSFIGNLSSLGGGGLLLPPFKSLPWLITTNTVVGLYGACPKVFDPTFYKLDPEWLTLQQSCTNIFTTNNGELIGRSNDYINQC
jgi:hypothetical protein